MHLIDKQHIALFKISEKRGEVAGLGNHGPRRGAEIHAKLAGHDLSQGSLAEPGRTDEENMIERLAPRARRLDEHAEIPARLLLTDEFRKPLRAQRRLGRIFVAALRRNELASGDGAHPSAPRLYLFGKSSPIGTTAGDLPFGTITRAFGS